MLDKRLIVGMLVGAVLAVGNWVRSEEEPTLLAQGKDKEVKKEPAKRKGTVVGTLVKTGPAFIEVKADGEEKARRYVPHWVGGAPAAGGGPDKKVLEIIRKLKVGSRVRVEWEFQERPRVVRVEVIQAGKGGEKGKQKEIEKKSAR